MATQHYATAHEQLVIEIYVRDLRCSLAFYQSFGFKLIRAEDTFAELQWDDSLLFLEECKQLASPPFPVANIRVLVPNVDEYWALAQRLGVRILKPVGDRYYGLRDFTLVGPDDVALRFATPLAT